MPLNFQRILITGGAGFIGSHLAEAMLRQGKQVTIVDNLDSFYSPAWKEANLDEITHSGSYDFYAADICEREGLRKILQHAEPEVVIHLAARAGVRPSIEQPCLYERVNIAGTVNLLELCRAQRISRFVFGSSSSVYGATSRVPFCEEHQELRPISPYAATKLAGELLCYTYAHLYRLSVVCLRFFTVYGPRQRPDLAIHKFTSLIECGKPLPIFGDGGSGRDFTFVDDIVAGISRAIAYEIPDGPDAVPFDIFNLGNSHPVKLAELIALLEQATGQRAIRETLPCQPGDVPITWADISKSRRLLGYEPATPLKEGLTRFVDWYRATSPDRRL